MDLRYTVPAHLSREDQLLLIKRGEEHFEEQVDAITARVTAEADLHLIGLTGPTCSGKTTAAEKLTQAFKLRGKTLHVISVDDFYYNKEQLHQLATQKGQKELDYDSEDTIDTELLRLCAESLIRGDVTRLPRFNFQTGLREAGETVRPQKDDVFLFEGIQILYPKVEAILKGSAYQSLYISPRSEIETGGEIFKPNEIRLLRRLVRDFRFRSTSPDFTLRLWKSVRENEEKSIFPYAHHCEVQIDSTMPYEIGMLKPYLEQILPTLPQDSPNAQTASGILERLKRVQPIPSELLPEQSLYKEFI